MGQIIVRGLGKYLSSSIGSKQLMGITGVGLSLFLLLHMLGNLLILAGPEAFNMYGHKMTTNPLLYAAEIGLLVLFFTHVIKSISNTLRNRAARPVSYAKSPNGEKHTTPVSKTLMGQGIIILVFVILHLITFKYGPQYKVTYNFIPPCFRGL
jgi:succinate dehydrogenase / fumarate reductase cytochrome b subunit